MKCAAPSLTLDPSRQKLKRKKVVFWYVFENNKNIADCPGLVLDYSRFGPEK